MELSDSDLERYARHIRLGEVGGTGQKRLLAARVLLVGAGGIGAPAALYLAAAGVGHLGIVDDDRVELSNLQRQILYRTGQIGEAKTACAAAALGELNPGVRVATHRTRLDADNARALVAGQDLVIDGTDSFAARLAVNAACVAERVPLVSAALGAFEGQLALFAGHLPDTPCYRCFVGDLPADTAGRSCAEIGILGAVAGVVGAWAALEALRALLDIGDSLAGRMLLLDARTPATRTIRLKKDPACPVCAVPGGG